MTLNKRTGEYKGYDVKAFAKRKLGVKFKNKFGKMVRRSPGGRINRGLTKLQKKIKNRNYLRGLLMGRVIRNPEDWDSKWENFKFEEFTCKCGCGTN